GLTRTMAFAPRKYNMHLTTGSMLLEVGTDSNSFEEAKYSAELAGDALLSLLNTLK
ncbi:MAG: stage II sporulation protein P, partial [Clostridia bacterium]|nr:stage II sporulation protein P [Clostridia bacterium]